MKTTLLLAAAIITLASCQKERDYLCQVESGGYEATIPYNSVTVPFHGTVGQKVKYEADHSFGVKWVSPIWQSCTCR